MKLASLSDSEAAAINTAAGDPRTTDAGALQTALREVLQVTSISPPTYSDREGDPETPSARREATISRTQVTAVCEKLDKMHRAAQVSSFQSGAMLHEALLSAEADEGEEKGAPLQTFLDWWLAEDAAEALHAFMLREFGARAQLLERSTAHNFCYRVQLTAGTGSDGGPAPAIQEANANNSHVAQSALSDIFAKFEAHKAALRILEYSVGQTTLEQIFNQFASQQDNPEVLGQASAGTGGGGVVANPLVS